MEQDSLMMFDMIHGNIIIDPLAQKIIDTEEFQRLRNIKQLGCCNYVFPSATHTRFEHSIGVYYLADKYIKILLKQNINYFTDDEILCIKIGALIHDIGHGPYSHLFDRVTFNDHEYRSIQIFKYMNKKYELGFDDKKINMIEMIINPKKYQDKIPSDKKYIYQIVSNSNGIDVDRFDYLIRDIKMTGLNYGIEYERIMNHSYIQNNEIVYSEKIKTNINDFFHVRFIMYKEVYNHHTVRSIEYMMKEYIQLLDIYIGISELIETENWPSFIKLTDNITSILPFLPKSDKINKLKCMVKNINERKIYKMIGEIISDSDVNIHDKTYNSIKISDYNDIIIDKVKISYYGKEDCKYILNDQKIYNLSTDNMNHDIYLISIYYKDNKDKQLATSIFESIKL